MNQKSENLEATSKLRLLAACDDTTDIVSLGVNVTLHIHDAVGAKHALTSAINKTSRIYLALESIRGTFDAAVLRLLLTPHRLTNVESGDEVHLGSVALFGLRTASSASPDGKSTGMTTYLDVTPKAKQFEEEALVGNAHLQISIRPHNKLPEGVAISIERVRLYVEPASGP